MAYSANGSTFTFASTAETTVTSIDFANNTAAIDISTLSAGEKKYEAGKPDPEVTIEGVGEPSFAIADSGALAISWNSGGSSAIVKAVCTGISINGGIDSPVTFSATFKPTTS